MPMRLGLQTRLLISHLLVMLTGLISFLIISNAASQHLFSGHLADLEDAGLIIRSTRLVLFAGFQAAWHGSSLIAMCVGTLAATGLSYWIAQRITQPLNQMERIARQFAAGQFDEQVPPSSIPELDRLGNSFNRLAVSLEDVEMRRRELIGEVTHELRTPLTIVRGYLEAFANQQIAPTPKIYTLMVRETKRLERLVNHLQELSKAEAGHLTLNLQPIALPTLLGNLMQQFSTQVLEDELVLQMDCPPNLPPVLADYDRLEQILVNLIGNALRHTRRGSITLQAWEDAHQVWVAVQDTGTGIAPDELPHVFERFWRSRQNRQDAKGTGIGLAITKRLVELQGGQIEVESQLGQGSTFRFSLPIA
ncbi:sensor histidine kinase [Thermocoleostomius sinensis]|uniref:histidine kinase n=1 Tax=Thermocoleostomius sinensis A174 TaxID=2016057 RepID=A0A9E8ZDI8_9CYAN|nr:HAMP domain-containing sensor histidine kinase [Thermocoleostomius sinensis A174]